jgi:anaerobic nitric oxide reductase flavorubredoxin
MYGMTAKCLEAIEQGIKEAGAEMLSFNLSNDKDVDALTALVEAPAIVVGSSTYEHEVFPKVTDFLNLLKIKGFSNRCAGVFGSFGWSGEATRKLELELTNMGFELVDKPLRVHGSPTKEDLQQARQLGKAIAKKAFSKFNLS